MRIRSSKPPPSSSISNPTPSPSALPTSDSPASIDSASRCEGLDLLVLAAIEVFGDGALEAEHIGSNGVGPVGDEEGRGQRDEKLPEESDDGDGADSRKKRRKRQLVMPSRFHDSVMQSWKRRTLQRQAGAKRSW